MGARAASLPLLSLDKPLTSEPRARGLHFMIFETSCCRHCCRILSIGASPQIVGLRYDENGFDVYRIQTMSYFLVESFVGQC